MSKLLKKITYIAPTLSVALIAGSASAQYVADPLTEEDTVTLITDMLATVTNVLGGTLPTIFGLVALLIGAMWVFRFVKKHVGRAK